jgi:hypothetical protein
MVIAVTISWRIEKDRQRPLMHHMRLDLGTGLVNAGDGARQPLIVRIGHDGEFGYVVKFVHACEYIRCGGICSTISSPTAIAPSRSTHATSPRLLRASFGNCHPLPG